MVSKESVAVVMPDAAWTFEHALLLLQQERQGPKEDHLLGQCLESFLKANSEIYTAGNLPFTAKKTANTIPATFPKQFTIRSVQYENDLLDSSLEYTKEIASSINLDPLEVLRVTITASKRIPKLRPLRLTEDSLKSLVEDSDKAEKMSYFTVQVLREQRTIVRTCLLLIKNKHAAEATQTSRRIFASIVDKGDDLIASQLDRIDAITEQMTHHRSQNFFDAIILRELSLTLLDILHYTCYLVLVSSRGFTKPTVSRWFLLMTKTDYLAKAVPSSDVSDTLESLCTIATLLFLDLDFNFGSLTDNSSYMNDPDDMLQITNSILDTPANPIVLYAWSILLHRKYTVLQSQPDHPKTLSFIERFGSLAAIENQYTSFAAEAARLDVPATLRRCHGLISYDPVYCDVLGSFAISFVPYVKMADDITAGIARIMSSASEDIVKRFFNNPAAQDMLSLARAKLPLSLRSFIALTSINTNLALEEFETLSSYMQAFSQSDFCYKYAIDDANPDLVRLLQDIDVYPPFEPGKELSLLLREGTKAQLFPGKSGKDENGEVVAAFLYEYSGWALLGRVLRNLSTHLDRNDSDKLALLSQIFTLLARVFTESDNATTEHVIYSMNAFVGENDIIDIIFRVLDQLLVLRDVSLLAGCVDVITAFAARGYAYRVWSYLYKSSLLGLQPRGGLASTVRGMAETVEGDFSFTVSLLQLSSILVDDCIVEDAKSHVSRKLKGQVFDRLVAYCLQAFESFVSWKYLTPSQRPRIGELCVRLFNNILSALYGIDENSAPEKRINAAFCEPARRITNAFLVTKHPGARCLLPLMALVDSIASQYSDCFSSDKHGCWTRQWVRESSQFVGTLIKVRSAVRPDSPSSLELSLCTRLPQLVTIYLNNPDKRQLVAELLTALVGAKWTKEPPSLLTHLRPTHAEILLRCLSCDMANRAGTYGLKMSLYDFFSSVMEGGQEGLSIVFITGRDIKESMKDSRKDSGYGALSLLSIMKRDVAVIAQYPSNVALHLADAISLAFSSWISAEQEADDTSFVKQLLTKLDDFPKTTVPEGSDSQAYIDYCYEVLLLSKVTEIVSIYLFVSRSRQERQLILQRLNETKFIDNLASKFQISGYQESAQDAVKDKFHEIWPQFQLSQFVRASSYRKHHFGKESVYCFELMDLIFDGTQWQQMRKEIVAASVNLQYVSAQISTAKAYAALVTCLCKVGASELNVRYLRLAGTLLRACDDEGIPSGLFYSVFQARIELAFYICLSFSQKKQFTPDGMTLFNVITSDSRLLDSREINLTQGLLSDGVSFYKPLLRILLICIGLLRGDSNLLIEYSATFCDIFSEVICRSTKLLFDSIRASALKSPNAELGNSKLVAKQVDDVTIVLSMLKSFLHLNLPEDLQHSVAKVAINSGAFRSLASLYSVSHLIKVNGEEIFADYALMFIYEMVSSSKAMAHNLLQNGLFSVLLESPISVRIQAGNVRPYPISRSRLQHLWSNGILPIVLQILKLFGDSVLPEACLFATAFDKQINSTIQAWFETDSAISTQFIEETSQIIVLAKALSSLDAYNYIRNSTATDEEEGAIRLVPGLDTADDRHKLAAALNYLISHPKYLTLRIIPSNSEEQRALQSDDSVKFIEGFLAKLKELKASLED
ncbi:DEKNAAC101295 [Brettanomyces naardenensis]|uniref:Nucleoporin NUP188 n=1 Tax=Brettanomyces naardenensis TaxID=13370 RepID=A0A448YHW2_BRENA|nr:DEKNAAC101295 [Brettanomyces naardenensis]